VAYGTTMLSAVMEDYVKAVYAIGRTSLV